MKLYAVIHAVCGLSEGYSDTTANFFLTLDEARQYKDKLVESLTTIGQFEQCQSMTDGMEDIVSLKHDPDTQEIAKIITLTPTWDENDTIREYLVWNQMDCEAPFDGDYLPSDMSVIKDACERMESVSETFSTDVFHEFIRDLYYNGDAMLDADDLCIHYLRVPKSKNL
jgi:hypothetical protein